MGLLGTLGSAAIQAGVNYASSKYAADSRIEATKLQNKNVMDRVKAEHENSLERMKKSHEYDLDKLNVQHGYDMDTTHTRGKYDIFNSLISGVSSGVSAGIRAGLIGKKKDDSNSGKGGGGLTDQQAAFDAKWEDLVRQMNGVTGVGSKTVPGFSSVPASTLLTTGGALASGIAGVIPLLGI